MDKNIKKNILAKFFAGIATDKEKELVYHWQESEKMLKAEWDSTEDAKLKFGTMDREKVKAGLFREINKNQNSGLFSRSLRFYLRYAAIFLIPVLSAALIYYLWDSPAPGHYTSTIEKQNQKGIRSELILPDGSKVWLNAESRISYPEKFSTGSRLVSLEGEACFEVVKNPNSPFIVKTSKVDIEVLGTKFNVKSYIDENFIETTLIRGKVSVKRINPETGKLINTILTPNQQATFKIDEEKFLFSEVEADKFIAWTHGKLVIDSEPLLVMARKLERWYNVEIFVSPELASKHSFTLTITNETLEDVLVLIKKTTPGLTIDRKNNQVWISEKDQTQSTNY